MKNKIFTSILLIPILFLSLFSFASAGISAYSEKSNFQDIYSAAADPPTPYSGDYFYPSTSENGHIWIDKTVNAESATFYDRQKNPMYTLDTNPDEFLVTLSALAQSYSAKTIVEPADTAFILDVSTESDITKPDFSGYLTISDPIGKYMHFSQNKGVWYNGAMHFGDTFAKAITQEPAGGPTWPAYEDVLSRRLGVSKSTARDIILTGMAGGAMYYNNENDFKSTLIWYTDSDTEYVGSYYDSNGHVLPPPQNASCIMELHPMNNEVFNEIAGQSTSQIFMYFSVTTALVSGSFGLKGIEALDIPLIAGQQLIRWYIPASLIPMRTVSEKYDGQNPGQITGLEIKEAFPVCANYTVTINKNIDISELPDDYKSLYKTPDGKGCYFYTNSWQPRGMETKDIAMAVFEPNKYNPYYYFTEDTPVYIFDGSVYKPADSYSPGTDHYTVNKYFDENVPGYIVSEYDLIDQTITKISVGSDNKPYVAVGEHKKNAEMTVLKTRNLTGTYDFKLDVHFIGSAEIYYLGNNGRLTINNITDLSVKKIWQGLPGDSVWVQLYANGIPCREPAFLNNDNNWHYAWEELLTHELPGDTDGKVSFINYTIVEGEYENNTFIPFSEKYPLYGFKIKYKQPVWDDNSKIWSDAVITNTSDEYIPPEEEPEADHDLYKLFTHYFRI